MKQEKRFKNLETRRRDYEKMRATGKDEHGCSGFKRPGSNKK